MVADIVLFGRTTVETFLIFILVVTVTIIAGNTLYLLLRRLLDPRTSGAFSKRVSRLLQYVFFFSGLGIAVYRILDLDFSALAASLGILSIAIAFSSQQVLQNMIGGVIVSVNRSIRPEDWVEVGTSGLCRVKDMRLMHTVLRHQNGRLIYLPNTQLLTQMVHNYSKSGFIETALTLSVVPGSDLSTIRDVAREVASKNQRMLPNISRNERSAFAKIIKSSKQFFEGEQDLSRFSPRVLVTDVTATRMMLSVRVWLLEIGRRDDIVSDYLSTLSSELNAKGIVLA